MYHQIGGGSLYRVTDSNSVWPDPVRGLGAFYVSRGGSRYNTTHQQTVSCAEDPLVVISEAAFYQALKWREAIADSLIKPASYPFHSNHLFWMFRLDPVPPVIDLEDPLAASQFGYAPHVVTNPSQNYRATQEIANQVRTYAPPLGSPNPTPEGVRAPSVRTPMVGAYQPKQLALFVIPRPGIIPYEQRCTLTGRLRLEFDFVAAGGGVVAYSSAAVDWTKPRYRLTVIPGEPAIGPIPPLPGRPGGKPTTLNRWHKLKICF